jgi:hypothetical protein
MSGRKPLPSTSATVFGLLSKQSFAFLLAFFVLLSMGYFKAFLPAEAVTAEVQPSTSVRAVHASNKLGMPVGPKSLAIKVFLFAPNYHHFACETLLGYFLALVAASGLSSRRSIQACHSGEALVYRPPRHAMH